MRSLLTCTGLRFALAVLLVTVGSLYLSSPARAQLSPGSLSQPHAELEGTSNCLECHSSGKGVDPDLCLSCHRLLGARIEARRGLHARPEYADCKSCHIDHHGREFELVWWGEQGIESFDHELAGLALEGAHRGLDCRQCHREELNPGAASLRGVGKDPARSFLGLSAACSSCHRDEHRGQFEAERCLSCHEQGAWSPAGGFAHSETRFPLTGLHSQVTCGECHAVVEEEESGDPDFVRFVDLPFADCAACHRDPHAGRLGAECSGCHTSAGWQGVDDSRFDHDLTRYALRGRHRSVGCESCHRSGEEKRGLAFAVCSDCHVDEHAGQFRERADGGRCESCHTVEGFRPSTFTPQEHERVFVLEGSHRSVECAACHLDVAASNVGRSGLATTEAAGERATLTRFRFDSVQCAGCHDDPHAGTAMAMSTRISCDTCHTAREWNEIWFEHAGTGFELVGPHAELTCTECHVRRSGPVGSPDFSGLETSCATCHEDRHRGQFGDDDRAVDCQRCHQVESWIPASGFDHSADAAFALEGAHARVPCEGCHRYEMDGDQEFARYRPLASRCSDCHAGSW